MRTGAATAASLAVAVALSGCGGTSPSRDTASTAPQSYLPTAGLTAGASGRPAVPPSPLLRAFPILRRPARSGGRPAGQARAMLGQEAREERRLGEAAVFVNGARRLPDLPATGPSWLVPAPNRLCLLRALSGAPAAPETIDCVGIRAAARGYLLSAIVGPPGAQGRTALEGVLPAGAAGVRLELADGASAPLTLHEGAYGVYERDALLLRFRLAGCTLTVPVPHAPPGAAPGP
jgi:hypothetical protein